MQKKREMCSRMDQVKFVKAAFKKFTWSILEYVDPNTDSLGYCVN